MCVCVGAFMIVESPECDIFSSILPPTFSPDSAWLIPLLLFQASNLKFALPVVSIHRLVKQKLRGATQWLTCLSLSSFTLRMHTNAKHCSTFFFFFLIGYSLASFVVAVYFGVTHMHTFVSPDVGQIMCLYRIYKHGTRSVGRLRASPTSLLLC